MSAFSWPGIGFSPSSHQTLAAWALLRSGISPLVFFWSCGERKIALAIAALYVPRLFVLALGQFGFLPVWLSVGNFKRLPDSPNHNFGRAGRLMEPGKFLARVFDFVGGHLLRAPGISYFKTEIIDKFGPIHRLDRSTIQKGLNRMPGDTITINRNLNWCAYRV